ncbi:MAG TPA: putative toxin-antitoxin system toxin component, PIN family [Syntrophomonadaceae bacterium]|nr:putative toxin-antitoxin system toxin component, PIN family [Syntrophomonadaceae bacterium]
MLKAVLDTNILVSGLISPGGTPALLIGAWREKKFELVLSPAILEEVAEVLLRDKIRRCYENIDKDLPRKDVTGLRRFAALVTGRVEAEGICADPQDDKFIAAALEANADYLVSGDGHLLSHKEHRGEKIVRPAEFLARL